MGTGRAYVKVPGAGSRAGLAADAGAVREWADVARHTADGRVATNILRVLANLPVAVKRSVLGATYDEWADWAMRPDLPVRRALVLALLVDLHEPGRWRPDLLDYAMLHATDAAVDYSTRAYLIKLMAVMCRSYPDLAREVETFLDVLPPDAPPSLRAAGPAAVAAAKSAERPERVSGCRARLCVRVKVEVLAQDAGPTLADGCAALGPCAQNSP